MAKMPCHISDGEPEDDRLEWEGEPEAGPWLICELNLMIAHISEHNSFDKQDLINLLKRARNYIHDKQ